MPGRRLSLRSASYSWAGPSEMSHRPWRTFSESSACLLIEGTDDLVVQDSPPNKSRRAFLQKRAHAFFLVVRIEQAFEAPAF